MKKTRTFKRILGAVTAAALSLSAIGFSSEIFTYNNSSYELTASADPGAIPGNKFTITGQAPFHYFNGEAAGNLFDGNDHTKVCTRSNTEISSSNPFYVEFTYDFESEKMLKVSKYTMTTANDSASFTNRNPKNWCLKAKKNTGDAWTPIAEVNNDNTLSGNYTSFDYDVKNEYKDTAYKYFRFEVSEVHGMQDGWCWLLQLAELEFTGEEADSDSELKLGNFDSTTNYAFVAATGTGTKTYKSLVFGYSGKTTNATIDVTALSTDDDTGNADGYKVETDLSTSNYSYVINFTDEKTANEVATECIRKIKFQSAQVTQVYFSLNKEKTTTKTVYYAANRHYYQYIPFGVSDTDKDWITAYNAAKDKTYAGMKGYLATATSAEENDYIFSASGNSTGWLGGTRMKGKSSKGNYYTDWDIPTSGDLSTGTVSEHGYDYWYWACGPEKDKKFYTKAKRADGGQTVAGMYSCWNNGEPNNSPIEVCLTTTGNSKEWNDLGCKSSSGGYFVEFGDCAIGDSGNVSSSNNDTIFITTNIEPALYTVKFVTKGTTAFDADESNTADQTILCWNPIFPITEFGYRIDYYTDSSCSNVWNVSAPITQASPADGSPKTLYVKRTAETYDIDYDLDGGELPSGVTNDETYSFSTTETKTLNNPVKSGYVFTGWSGTGLTGENNLTVIIPKGATGHRAYTAHWEEKSGGQSYEIIKQSPFVFHYYGGNKMVLAEYDDSLEDVVIPETVNDIPVTEIGSGSFNSCTKIKSLVIPSTVKTIENSAFWGCGIEEIDLPETVNTIESSAFSNCKSLKKIVIRNKNCSIDKSASTICNGYNKSRYDYSGAVYGWRGSTAEQYATKYGYTFIPLDPEETTEPEEETKLGRAKAPWLDENNDVHWDAVEGAVKYQIVKEHSNNIFFGKETADTSYKQNYVPDFMYKVYIRSFDAKGNFTDGDALTVYPELGTAKAPWVDNKGYVHWEAVKNAAKYRIVKEHSGKTFLGDITKELEYKQNYVPDFEYKVYIRSYDEYGNHTDGEVLTVPAKPNAPWLDENDIIHWEAVEGAVNYQIVKTHSGRDFFGDLTDELQYKQNYVPTFEYKVFVRAYDENGDFTDTATLTVPAKIALGVAKAPKVDGRTVTWTAVENAVYYKVGKTVGSKTVFSDKVYDTTYTFQSDAKSNHKLFIAAFDGEGNRTFGARRYVKVN